MSESGKLILFNALSDPIQWNAEPPTITKPPVITTAGATTLEAYINISGIANLINLVRDGSQNIQLVFDATGFGLRIDWGTIVAPRAIAIINHNCWESGDHIEIKYDLAETLAVDIASPNRSADIFYPLRMNDAWVNSGTPIDSRYWFIYFYKTSGKPFVGEIFFSFDQTSYYEFNPQPDVGIGISYIRNASRNNTIAGAPVIYDTLPPSLRWALNWSRKKKDVFQEGDTDFIVDWPMLLTSQTTQGNRKSVFIWKNDRVCQMVKLAFSGNEGISPDRSVAPSLTLLGEFPRKALRENPDLIPS